MESSKQQHHTNTANQLNRDNMTQTTDQLLASDRSEASQEQSSDSCSEKYLELIKQLQLQLGTKSDECELLKIKLMESNQYLEELNSELNDSKLTIFESSADSKRIHEEVVKSKKLEEDYVKLMGDYLNLSERSEQFRQNLVESYLEKSNAINNHESFISSGAIQKELHDCKANLMETMAQLSLARAKMRNSEEESSQKEKNITELKKTLEDAKVSHRHEINVHIEYIQSLKNTISSYEKTLTSYIDTKLEDTSSS